MKRDSEKPPYFVTGAIGFVGSALVRHLLANDRQPTALVGRDMSFKSLEGLSIETREIDLRNHQELVRSLEEATHLFHVAADYRFRATDPNEIYRTAVQGTRNVLDTAEHHHFPFGSGRR